MFYILAVISGLSFPTLMLHLNKTGQDAENFLGKIDTESNSMRLNSREQNNRPSKTFSR